MNKALKNKKHLVFGVRSTKTGLKRCISVDYSEKIPNKNEHLLCKPLNYSELQRCLPNIFCSDDRTKSVRLNKLQVIVFQRVKRSSVHFCSVKKV